ncbi:MAG: 6-phosphofructokinase [Schwartzia sp.]|nr:6-phosphofructokinase [Schwartzia sp. (in: firmicutes)]
MRKTIAVMTSGGDSPGMNAATRAVVRTALYEGAKVFGIYNGYRGLLENDMVEMNSRSVSDIIQRGGTILGTARSKEFTTPEGRAKAAENLQARGIEGLVVIGGDGSLRGAQKFTEEHNFAIVGLPGTIDNDIWGMDYTIGSDTAANTIIDAINKLRDTASAHRRIAILEVMGRHSGWLALITGMSGGAEYILVPEDEFDLDAMSREIRAMYEENHKRYVLIIVAEGAGSAIEIAKQLEEKTGIDTRASVLGHIQRGGSPTVADRVYASTLGECATRALLSGVANVVFGIRHGRVVNVNLYDAVNRKKQLDPEYIRMAKILA